MIDFNLNLDSKIENDCKIKSNLCATEEDYIDVMSNQEHIKYDSEEYWDIQYYSKHFML